jgi:hypothetical protein
MKSKALKVWFKARMSLVESACFRLAQCTFFSLEFRADERSGALVSTFECAGVGAGAEEAS